MAQGITDVAQWLNNRLGSSEKTWVDGSIAPYLTKEFLKEANDCFLDLPASVKIKLLLSFLHIVRRNLETLRPELESIIELAIKDDQDQWVSLTAEFLRNFPSKGEFNLNILHNATMFNEMRNDIKKHLKKLADRGGDLYFVPYEAEFMNKKAFLATFGNLPPPKKHFTLKQKPKSATLRADALAKASDPTKPRIQPGSSIPVRFKDNSRSVDSLISSQHMTPAAKRALAANAISRVQAAKQQTLAAKGRGGVKLLDITEQPLGQELGSKRRRRLVGVPVNLPGEGGVGGAKDEENLEIPDQLERPDSPELPEGGRDTDGSQEDAGAPPHSPEMPPPLQPYQSVLATPLMTPPVLSPPILSPPLMTPPILTSPVLSPPVATTSPRVSPEKPTSSQGTSSIPQIVQAPALPLANFRNMTLPKEVQTAIAETFATANRVTRPEKILIINFIAGIRENPCPHLGPVLTIRLSEHPTRAPLPEGGEVEALVEEYFHMNFATGEWKRLRKHKPLTKDTPTKQTTSTPLDSA